MEAHSSSFPLNGIHLEEADLEGECHASGGCAHGCVYGCGCGCDYCSEAEGQGQEQTEREDIWNYQAQTQIDVMLALRRS